jgi:hypothetical protein
MIELKDNKLEVSFPEVHEKAKCSISFQRTLRIPDDNNEYPLPAGLGDFPLFHVDDYGNRIPSSWKDHGGVFFPMYQSEAMWINFDGSYPMAIKVAAGKINAVTGENWSNKLTGNPQDYLVRPEQEWLDGYSVAKDHVRQFIAAPLGQGHTAEEQITGKAEFGGLQFIIYPMKRSEYIERFGKPKLTVLSYKVSDIYADEMGLAPGGLIKQNIHRDTYGLDVWDHTTYSRCYTHLLNSLDFERVTGQAPPTKPITPKEYEDAGVPWFDLYDGKHTALSGSDVLSNLDSYANSTFKKTGKPLSNNQSIPISDTVKIKPDRVVRDGEF